MTREEAIENIKKALPLSDTLAESFYTLHPELAESEDERIRKFLVDYFVSYKIGNVATKLNGVRIDDILNYLKKQKEQKDYRKLYEDIAKSEWFKKAYAGKSLGEKDDKEEQKPIEIKIDNPNIQKFDPDMKITTSDSSASGKELLYVSNKSYNIGYRDGHRFGLKQTEDYMIGKTFKGLIPCWVNAPSELQPAHKYHGKNVVIMNEDNGGFRCVCIDDEKPVTFHLPEDTLFVEGWRKKPAEWSEEDERKLQRCIEIVESWEGDYDIAYTPYSNFLKSLRPSWKPSEEDIKMLEHIIEQYEIGNKNSKVRGYLPRVEELNFLKKVLSKWKN